MCPSSRTEVVVDSRGSLTQADPESNRSPRQAPWHSMRFDRYMPIITQKYCEIGPGIDS